MRNKEHRIRDLKLSTSIFSVENVKIVRVQQNQGQWRARYAKSSLPVDISGMTTTRLGLMQIAPSHTRFLDRKYRDAPAWHTALWHSMRDVDQSIRWGRSARGTPSCPDWHVWPRYVSEWRSRLNFSSRSSHVDMGWDNQICLTVDRCTKRRSMLILDNGSW